LKELQSYKLVTIASWISRFIQIIAQLILIKIITSLINVNEYAVYTLMTGLTGWIMLSDFGLGTSLQNYISELRAQNHRYNDFIFTTINIVIILFIVFLIIFVLFSNSLGSLYLNQYTFLAKIDKSNIFFYSIITMLWISLSSIIYKIWYAEHKGYLSNIMPALGSLCSLAFLYSAQKYVLNLSLINVLLISLIPQAIFSFYFLSQLYYSLYKKSSFKLEIAKKLLSRGKSFFGFALLSAFVLQIDIIIISQYLSAEEIIQYTTILKFFTLGFFLYSSFLLAIWPIFSELLAKKDFLEVQKKLNFFIPLGVLYIIIFSLILYFTFPFIVEVLIKNTVISMNIYLTILFCIYFAIRIWTDSYAIVLQSMSYMQPFWKSIPLQALLSVFLQIFFVQYFGIYGVLYALILSFLLTVSWYLPKHVYILLSKENNEKL